MLAQQSMLRLGKKFLLPLLVFQNHMYHYQINEIKSYRVVRVGKKNTYEVKK